MRSNDDFSADEPGPLHINGTNDIYCVLAGKKYTKTY